MLLISAFFISGCGGGGGDDGGGGGGGGRKWTYMVYLAADNDLSDAGLDDLNEMEMVGSTSEVAIVVQAEFSQTYSSGVPTNTLRFFVQKDNNNSSANLSAGQSIGNVNMGSPAALTAFINWAKTNYPAENYALVIWDHGAGWKTDGTDGGRGGPIRGAVQDLTSGSFMSLPDLAKGVRDSGLHFKVINFDACLMAMYEVAYEFRGLADYMAFAEETEPGDGDPYDTILAALTASPSMSGRTLAEVIVDKYGDFYSSDGRASTTKSAMDMSQVVSLDSKVRELAAALSADPSTSSVVQAAQSNTQHYAYKANHDIYDMCRYLNTNLPSGTAKTAAGQLMSMIPGMIVRNRTIGSSVANSHGLAIYLPSTSETNSEDMGRYALLACNGARASSAGTWGSYIEALISGQGGGAVTYAAGGFGFWLDWGACNADLDLYVWEPAADYQTTGNGQWYAPYGGVTTPNGFFSPDSADSGKSYEYYLSNSRVYKGGYWFAARYYANGPTCTSAAARFYYLDPAYGVNDWLELSASNGYGHLTYPSPQTMNLQNYWWNPAYISRAAQWGLFPGDDSLTLEGKPAEMIFMFKR